MVRKNSLLPLLWPYVYSKIMSPISVGSYSLSFTVTFLERICVIAVSVSHFDPQYRSPWNSASDATDCSFLWQRSQVSSELLNKEANCWPWTSCSTDELHVVLFKYLFSLCFECFCAPVVSPPGNVLFQFCPVFLVIPPEFLQCLPHSF